MRSTTVQELRPYINVIECEEQIKSLLKENMELDYKSKNLLDIIKIKEDKIEELQKQIELFAVRNNEIEERLVRHKHETNNLKQEFINKRNRTVQIESVIQFNSNPGDQEELSKIEENNVLNEDLVSEKHRKSDSNYEFLSRNIQYLDVNERKRSKLSVVKYFYLI